MRKRTLLTALGLLSLGLASGLIFSGPVKEKNMDVRESLARSAEQAAVNRDSNTSPQERTETATFAMG